MLHFPIQATIRNPKSPIPIDHASLFTLNSLPISPSAIGNPQSTIVPQGTYCFAKPLRLIPFESVGDLLQAPWENIPTGRIEQKEERSANYTNLSELFLRNY